MTVTEFLRNKVPFLQGLTEDQAHYLAQSAEQKTFRMGQTVIFKGVSVEGLHVVGQGKVSVHVKPDKSKDWQKVADLGPGEIFGEMSIVDFCMAGATIKSQADDTLIFIIPQAPFRKILATDPELEKRTMALIESRRPKPKGKDQPEVKKPAS